MKREIFKLTKRDLIDDSISDYEFYKILLNRVPQNIPQNRLLQMFAFEDLKKSSKILVEDLNVDKSYIFIVSKGDSIYYSTFVANLKNAEVKKTYYNESVDFIINTLIGKFEELNAGDDINFEIKLVENK